MSRAITASKASSRSSSTTLPTVRAVCHWRKKLKVHASAPDARIAAISSPAFCDDWSMAMVSSPRAIKIGSTALISESSTIIVATKPIAAKCGRK
jgi:hypothetical protein